MKTKKKVTAKKRTTKAVIKTSKRPAKKITGENKETAILFQKIRTKSKMTQKEFSTKLGISQSHLSKLENGTQEINILIAKKLHKDFKIPSNKLLKL